MKNLFNNKIQEGKFLTLDKKREFCLKSTSQRRIYQIQ